MKVRKSRFGCRGWQGMALAMAVAYLAQAAPHGHDAFDQRAAHPAHAAPAAHANHAHHHDDEHDGHDSPQPAPHHHSVAQHLDSHSVAAGPRAGQDAPVALPVPAAVAPAADALALRRVAPPDPEPPVPDDPLPVHAPLRAPPA